MYSKMAVNGSGFRCASTSEKMKRPCAAAPVWASSMSGTRRRSGRFTIAMSSKGISAAPNGGRGAMSGDDDLDRR